jgi:predicted enzyme related to lactoylglutathione lyase
MSQPISLLVYPVKNLGQAKILFGKLLGVEPYVDGPYYVGFRVGEFEIGLDPNGHAKGANGPIGFWTVGDITQALQTLLDAGAQLQQDVGDVGGGLLVALVKDADGNVLGLRQGTTG